MGGSGLKPKVGSVISRSYLSEASEFDGGGQDRSYMKSDNNAICEKVELMPKKLREKFEMKQRERERRLEAQKYKNFENNNELLGHLQKKRVGMDRILRLNSDQKYCLLCNKNTISIVLMNCGHAYQCKSCYNPKNRVCQVCKSEVFFCVEMQNSDQDAPREKSKSKSPIKSKLQSESMIKSNARGQGSGKKLNRPTQHPNVNINIVGATPGLPPSEPNDSSNKTHSYHKLSIASETSVKDPVSKRRLSNLIISGEVLPDLEAFTGIVTQKQSDIL